MADIIGSDAGETLDGTDGADIIEARGGDDTLDGQAGADRMIGGTGSDFYRVDNAGDLVIEQANEGIDTVASTIGFSLIGLYVENLILGDAGAINGRGNSFNNVITGGLLANTLIGETGDDVLNGGAGGDTLIGGKGDDRMVVGDSGDRVIEHDGEGWDRVESSVSWSLVGSYVESLTLTGNAAIGGKGNSLSNQITGNAAANTLFGEAGDDRLDGGGGADTLRGGAGSDYYTVDHVGDRVIENAGEGYDLVRSSVSFALTGQHIETLILTGSAATDGRGNGLDNLIRGNGGNNWLRGEAGNDWLEGSGGSDRLYGGAGADTFVFSSAADGTDIDLIGDFVVGQDLIVLDPWLFDIGFQGLSSEAFRIGTAALDADDRVLYDAATGTLRYDADGSGEGASLVFATMAAGLALSSASFTSYPAD